MIIHADMDAFYASVEEPNKVQEFLDPLTVRTNRARERRAPRCR